MKLTPIYVLLLCVGCGGPHGAGNLPAVTGTCINGFINNTPIPTGESGPAAAPTPSTSTLWLLWNDSQLALSTEPIPYLDGHSEPPNPAAATMEPECQAVVAVPDLTPQQLYEATGNKKWLTHAEPTGVFLCDGVPVYGCYVNKVVYCGASICWNSLYEVENAILCRLNECSGR